MATPMPMPAAGPPGGGQDPDSLIQTAIHALTQYAQAEEDPADAQAATVIINALHQLAQKNQAEPDAGPPPGAPNYRAGATATGQFFGPNKRY